MKLVYITLLIFAFISNDLFANQTQTRIYRNCTNFEYPVDINFEGRLQKIPLVGHSYEAIYDSINNYRLASVKHYFNGKHLPVYNHNTASYSGAIIDYSLVSTVIFQYDAKNRISAVEMRNIKNEPCHNQWGTAKYTYVYENPSAFDCYEFRYYIDYSDNGEVKKKPISLQILNQFHLEFQLLENKFWQRKTWFVGVKNNLREYRSFHPNGEPKTIHEMECNRMNFTLDLGKSGYEEYVFNDLALQIEYNSYKSDAKLYGMSSTRKTEITKENGLYKLKTQSFLVDNGTYRSMEPNYQQEMDSTFLILKYVVTDSLGSEKTSSSYDANGYVKTIKSNSFGGYSIIDSMINFSNKFVQPAIISSSYDSKGFLMELTRKDRFNNDCLDLYLPYKQEYTYYGNSDKVDSVFHRDWYPKKSDFKKDTTISYQTSYNNLGFWQNTGYLSDQSATYDVNSFLIEYKSIPYSYKYYLKEGNQSYTTIDSSFYYSDFSSVDISTYTLSGKNSLRSEEVHLYKNDETEKISWNSGYVTPFFSLELDQCKQLRRSFDSNARLKKVQYMMEKGDSIEIYYKFNDIPQNQFLYEDDYNFKASEMELRRNGKLESDLNGICRYYFSYDKHGNLIMKYGITKDGIIEQSGGYNKLNRLFAESMPDQLFDKTIIPKFEYNRLGLVSKVIFLKNDLISKGYDNSGVHQYLFEYDANNNPHSIVARDENTGGRMDDSFGICERNLFVDEFGNITHRYTKNKAGEINEREVTIKKFDGLSYFDDQLISERHFIIENNEFLPTSINGSHETNFKFFNSPIGNEIVIKSYKDEDGKLLRMNGVFQTRIETIPFSWPTDTVSVAYYNDLGYVSEENIFENLADSVFYEGKGWLKESLMKRTTESFSNISSGFKKETIFYNSKGKEVNNVFGYSRSIVCDSMPFYRYEKYYTEDGKLAYKGDRLKSYYVKETSDKEFEKEQVFLNEQSKLVKNEIGVSSVFSKMYWIRGIRVIENSYFNAKNHRKKTDKNGVHKEIYYLNNSLNDVVGDTLAFICFDKKNKVVSNDLGSFVSLFNDRYYRSPQNEVRTHDFDSIEVLSSNTGILMLDSVELTDSYSKFKFIYTQGTIYIDKNLKLLQEGTNKEYKLIKSIGIPMSKDSYDVFNENAQGVDENGYLSFYLYFEPLPKEKANYMFLENIYSPTAWNSSGYDIKIPGEK